MKKIAGLFPVIQFFWIVAVGNIHSSK